MDKATGTPDWNQEELDCGRYIIRRIYSIFVLAALLAISVGTLLYLFGLELKAWQIEIGIFTVAPAAAASVLLAGLPLLSKHLQPIDRFFKSMPDRVDAQLAKEALIRAINLPLYSGMRVLFLQGGTFMVAVSIAILLANISRGLGIELWQWAVCMVGSVMVASGHAILEYFATLSVLRPVVTHIQKYSGSLSKEERQRIVSIGMHRKLVLVSTFIVVIPLLILSSTLLLKVMHHMQLLGVQDISATMWPIMGWAVFVIVIISAISFLMSNQLSRDVIISTGRLLSAMDRVEHGHLDIRLGIHSSDEFANINAGFDRMVTGLMERERLRDAFGRYVAHELVEEIEQRGITMGGKTIEGSVLFADIRDFTALSETMAAHDIVELLNHYFSAIEPVIESEGGWINKFGGDSLLAVFGVPVLQEDHIERAVRASLKMRSALAEFNDRQKTNGRHHLDIGIGIHSGEMVAGNVGSPQRMEYTVIGDVVNMASRIEELNKRWSTDILISDAVMEAVGDRYEVKPMPKVKVHGKSQPIQVYALNGSAGAEAVPAAPDSPSAGAIGADIQGVH